MSTQLTRQQAKEWIYKQWDELDQDRKLLSTVAKWIRKFGSGKQEGKQRAEDEETIRELTDEANRVFGVDKL